jgi:hypothetical protein
VLIGIFDHPHIPDERLPLIGIMHVIRVGAGVAERSFLAGECVPVLVGVNVVHARCAARAPR